MKKTSSEYILVNSESLPQKKSNVYFIGIDPDKVTEFNNGKVIRFTKVEKMNYLFSTKTKESTTTQQQDYFPRIHHSIEVEKSKLLARNNPIKPNQLKSFNKTTMKKNQREHQRVRRKKQHGREIPRTKDDLYRKKWISGFDEIHGGFGRDAEFVDQDRMAHLRRRRNSVDHEDRFEKLEVHGKLSGWRKENSGFQDEFCFHQQQDREKTQKKRKRLQNAETQTNGLIPNIHMYTSMESRSFSSLGCRKTPTRFLWCHSDTASEGYF